MQKNAYTTFVYSAIFLSQLIVLASSITCQDYPLNTYPYCNSSLSVSERVQDLMSRLTLLEKINLTNSDNGGVPRLGVPILGHSECTHGTFISRDYPQTEFPTTLFPQAVNLAQSFDRNLFSHVARAISNEVRGKYNIVMNQSLGAFNGFGLVCWAPVVNICRDPRWGRCQETYGEDPLLTGELAKSYIKALQHDYDITSSYLEVLATCKHFDGHNGPEDIPESRASFNAIINYRDWITTFQPAFRACHEAGVSSYMCSYNAINGVPACGNYELLTEILRNQWGFDGYVVSDCGAIPNIYDEHGVVQNYEEASEVAIKAGCDWAGICGGPSDGLTYLVGAINNGTLKVEYIDQAVSRVLPFWFKLGLLDPPTSDPWRNLNLFELYESHQSLAYEAALKSMVLLKNKNNILPITNYLNVSRGYHIAIIGPCANNTVCYTGDYNAEPLSIIPPYLAFEQMFKGFTDNLHYVSVCNDGPSCNDIHNEGITSMYSALKQSDIAIFVGGISVLQESEGHDRSEIELPYNQSYLFSLMYDFIKSGLSEPIPIISVLTYGAPAIDHFLFNNSDAIIGLGYAGERAGDALFTVLNGSYSPAGRTTVTWYQGTTQLPPMIDYNMIRSPGRTYRYLTKKPEFSFGYGLSYTQFQYSNLQLSSIPLEISNNNNNNRLNSSILQISPCNSIGVTVDVTNIGETYTSDEVIQVYLKVLNATVITDRIRLVNFTRIENIEPQQKSSVYLEIHPSHMSVTENYTYTEIIEVGYYQVFVGGILDEETLLTEQFQVVGANTPVSKCY